jgi:hypothetical protein
MTKTIAETLGRIGDKGGKRAKKKHLEKSVKSALLSSASLMKDVMSSSDVRKVQLCLDLKRSLEDIEKEYGITLI